MNLSPLAVQKFFDNAGRPLNGGLLFTYVSGTNTKLATYSNAAGTPNTNPIVLDFRGEARVWLDQTLTYRFILAPANDTDPPTNPIWSVDDITAAVTFVSLTQQILGQILYPRTTAEIAALVVPTFYIYPPGDVRRYGADPTGGASADAAFTQALAQAAQTNGAEITFPGTYLIAAGIVVTADGVHFRGSGIAGSILKAGANSINVLKIGAASGNYSGGFTIDSNSHTSVHGLVLAPSNEAAGPLTKISNNTVGPVRIISCAEGVRIRPGPTSFDQLYFNSLQEIELVNCTRSVWFQTGGTPANRNYFYNIRGGSTSTTCNTGLQIDSGSDNEFYALEFEGMLNGTSPNATPIGLLVGATSATDGNKFFGLRTEACTVGGENRNSLAEYYACAIFGTTNFILTARPLVFMGGYASNQLAQVFEGYLYQANNQVAGYPNSTSCFDGAGGAYLKNGPLRTGAQTATSGVGGSLSNFDWPFAYAAGNIYLVTRGAYDALGTSYNHRASVIIETSSGTFVEAVTRMLDLTNGAVAVATDSVTRSGANVRVGVSITKAATTFTNYATVARLT